MAGEIRIALNEVKSASWSLLPPMPSQREGGAAVAIHGSKIIVVGGYHSEQKFLKSCVVFDLSTKEWSEYPPMKTARMGCAAVYLEQHNAVVVVGGFQRGRKYLNTVEYLDLSTQRWHRLPSMQHPRAGCAAVTVLGKRVVVLGGWMDGETASGTVEVLDFNAQQWHTLPEMATPRAGCSAAAIGHRVLVLGGHTTSGKHRGCRASVEVLDLSSQKWHRMPSMKEKRDASASCVVGNCVLVLGGGATSTAPTDSAEILDVDNQVWQELPKMKTKRFGCSAAAVGNKIVVIGGRGQDGKHLETVECLELPTAEPGVSLGNFLDNHRDPAASSLHDAELRSMAGTLNTTVEQDRVRIKNTYESSKDQAQQAFERIANALEERLRILDKEREKIQEHIKKARRERDEAVAKAEKEKKEALAKLDAVRYSSTSQQAPATAPENLVPTDDELEPPSELCCCITGDLMDDPVTAMDGHTYERSAIEAWFARFEASQSPTSPLTNEPLPSRRLIPSHNIRSQCKTWREKLGRDTEVVVDPLANLTNGSSGGNKMERDSSKRSLSSSQHSGCSPLRSRPGLRGSTRRTPSTRERTPPSRDTTPTGQSQGVSRTLSGSGNRNGSSGHSQRRGSNEHVHLEKRLSAK